MSDKFDELLYYNASGVDINNIYYEYTNERAIGYDGEYQLFKYLISSSHFQYSKILTNLNIPVFNRNNKTTEIDILLITPQGIIVFEVKNYSGRIYGKDFEPIWTQYFVSANNNKFNNPIKQNQYHIDNLSHIVNCSKYHSFVYFANKDCNLSNIYFDTDRYIVSNWYNFEDELDKIAKNPVILSNDDIDALFNELKVYSKETDSPDIYSSCECKTINDFQSKIKDYVNNSLQSTKNSYDKQLNEAKNKYKRNATIITLIIAFISIFAIVRFNSYARETRNNAQKAIDAYTEMYDKFSEVSIGDIELAQTLLDVTDLTIQKHEYLLGSLVTFKITNNSSNAYLHFNAVTKTDQTKAYVMLKNGELQEYKIPNLSTIFPKKHAKFSLEIDTYLEDIDWIKLSPVTVKINSKATHKISIRVYDHQD